MKITNFEFLKIMKIKQGLFVIVFIRQKRGDEEEENKRKTQLKEKAK